MSQIINSADEIDALESERNQWRQSLDDLESKKDFGSTIFLIGSVFLVAALVFSPIFSLLLSVGMMVWGFIVYIRAAMKNKKADDRITEISSEVVRLRTKAKE